MKTFFLMVVTLMVAVACNKDDLTQDYRDTSMTWTVGAEHSTDTTVVLPTSAAPMNYLSVENYSICPNTRLQIIASSGSQVILDTIYQDKFTRYPLPSQAGKNVSVQSKLVLGDSLVLCVWLGQAVLKYEYGE